LYAVKQSGGNPKATQIHGDIDESADATGVAINELVGTIAKLAPNLGIVSRNVKCITEAIFTVNDYRTGGRREDNHDQVDTFVNYHSQMMMCTKDIARTAQVPSFKKAN
jgi:talin